MKGIRIEHVTKSFKEVSVLKDISFQIESGSFTVLLGPSGCGKSTLLRIIAGLETEDKGDVVIDERQVTKLEPKDRNLAMVFQNYALYPHMTAWQNIEYGLKVNKVPKVQRRKMVQEAIEMVELPDQVHKRPAQMSGGQRQRVALARAIVKNPKAFLMDEPLSNLDAKLRNQMREKISQLHRQLGTTFIYVTHDQIEAMSMGDHIIILNEGIVMQEGTPKEIYTNPRNIFVAGFIGTPPANIIACEGGYVAIRAEHIGLGEKDRGINLDATVLSVERLGDGSVYHLGTALGDLKIKAECNWEDIARAVRVNIPYETIMYFDEKGQRTEENESIRRYLESV